MGTRIPGSTGFEKSGRFLLVHPGIFRADPDEKLRFFPDPDEKFRISPDQPGILRAVTPVFSGSPYPVDSQIRVSIPDF